MLYGHLFNYSLLMPLDKFKLNKEKTDTQQNNLLESSFSYTIQRRRSSRRRRRNSTISSVIFTDFRKLLALSYIGLDGSDGFSMHCNRASQEINCIFCFAPVYVHNPPPVTLSFSVLLFSSHELLWCWFFNARTSYWYINGDLIN